MAHSSYTSRMERANEWNSIKWGYVGQDGGKVLWHWETGITSWFIWRLMSSLNVTSNASVWMSDQTFCCLVGFSASYAT